MTLVWLRRAERSLEAIADYIARENRQAAHTTILTDEPGNLALSCYHCNLHKGSNLTGIDPETGAVVVLFHPRRDVWETHFARCDARMVGLTPTGRITVRVLHMDAADRV